MAITASEARKNFFLLLTKVNEDRRPIEITSKNGDAVLVSRPDYEALTETAFCFASPPTRRDSWRAWPGERNEMNTA